MMQSVTSPPTRFGTPHANSRALLAKRFRAGKRHGNFVQLLHIILPTLLVAFIGFTLVLNFTGRFLQAQLPFNTDGLIINGSKLSMLSPNLNGYMKDNRAYTVKAERAEQDLKNPTMIDLFTMKADVELSDGGRALLVATEGTMQTDKEVITFRKGVTVTTTSGHFATTSDAFVDARAGMIVAPKHVHLKSPTGEMTADKMEIRDSGKYMLFTGTVKGYFIPSKADPSPDNGDNSQ